MNVSANPRDRFLTIYGRMPVLEALHNEKLQVDKVFLAENAHGASVTQLKQAAAARGVPVKVVSPQRVKLVAGNGRHDQGVAADVVAPRMMNLDRWLLGHAQASIARAVLLDGVTNPSNVGMVLRAATAAGLQGVVLPRVGTAEVGPLVIKSSAGVAFQAPIVRAETSAGAIADLQQAGFAVFGLSGTASDTVFDTYFPEKAVFVVGNETAGVGPSSAAAIDAWVSIPLAGEVESLNVATAAAILAYELLRRDRM